MAALTSHKDAESESSSKQVFQECRVLVTIARGCFMSKTKVNKNFLFNHNYIKIVESDWSSAGLISAVIGQLHTSCACNWTVVRVMPE